jgi:beta-lactamase superfamily II metal-dependent hydrolase
LFRSDTALAQLRNLDIYWVDVEGGAATLIVSPSGESLLVDSGWEVDDRDARRIFGVAQQAGLRKIDYFILSHYHADHAAGIRALAKMIPIEQCVDRGDFVEPANQKPPHSSPSMASASRSGMRSSAISSVGRQGAGETLRPASCVMQRWFAIPGLIHSEVPPNSPSSCVS